MEQDGGGAMAGRGQGWKRALKLTLQALYGSLVAKRRVENGSLRKHAYCSVFQVHDRPWCLMNADPIVVDG
jgi:hypothetical protein